MNHQLVEEHWLILPWAKLRFNEDGSASSHPLICHMIDVAAVTLELWQRVFSTDLQSEFSAALGFGERTETASKWIALWAGLHDLGKASPAFQLQVHRVASHYRNLFDSMGLQCPRIWGEARHGTVTSATLDEILQSLFNVDRSTAASIATIVGGHHGVFPSKADIRGVGRNSKGNATWQDYRGTLANTLAALLELPREAIPSNIDNATSIKLAGLVSVADWIGSDESYFPYASSTEAQDLAQYIGRARVKSATALKRLGWTGWVPQNNALSFTELFPDIAEPNELQMAVESISNTIDKAGLVIIEAPTGDGKTEASMRLIDHWTAKLGQRGCYFALPTQATSNQMFSRMRDFLANRYPEDIVNLQLLHGHASLSEEFRLIRENAGHLLIPGYEGVTDTDAADHNIAASEWFTYRKRGLLAPFGVGTIDQALMAVLQTKHAFVRLFGLANKTIVFDEVHAYDTYMTILLEKLVEWLAALGSSIVLLSATLPKQRREQLTRAFLNGKGIAGQEMVEDVPYPRVTWTNGNQIKAQRFETSTRSKKALELRWIDGTIGDRDVQAFELGARLREALSNGGTAAVICNTVRRAQEVYSALKKYFPEASDDGLPELDLLHSQFLFQHREERERRALLRFGKFGTRVRDEDGEKVVARPYRAVLVSTQIIEQSLDIDFDLMVTDIAPIDLLIQRAGRLHRHERVRPARLSTPALWINSLGMNGDVPVFDAGTRAVYDPHILLRTWLAIKEKYIVNVPLDVEELIEAVYGDNAEPDVISDTLLAEWNQSREALKRVQGAYESRAKQYTVLPPTYEDGVLDDFNRELEEDNPEVHSTMQALTRLSNQTVRAVLVSPLDRPILSNRERPDVATTRKLLERSITISHRSVVPLLIKESTPSEWQRSPLLRHHKYIEIDEDGFKRLGSYILSYSNELGLRITNA